jgi:hypothetical protein
MVFDIKNKFWTCIGQFGFRPSPRWNAAIAVSDQREQIYLFGGSSYAQGSCSNQVYCLDYKSSNVMYNLSESQQSLEEATLLTK